MRFACLLADGFEDIEALGTSALLRRAGFEIDFISVYNEKNVKGSYQTVVTDLKKIKNLIVDNYDGLFLPGGKAAYLLRENETVKTVVRDFCNQRKWILAICAAPTILGMMNLMDGLKYISYPGTEKQMGKAIRVEEKAVSDGKFITGKSAGSVYDFVFEIIRRINGEKALQDFKENIKY
jgi:putative intracellular protease/amidase